MKKCYVMIHVWLHDMDHNMDLNYRRKIRPQILWDRKSQQKNFIRTTLDMQGSNRLQTLDQLLGLFLDCKSIKSSGWLQLKLDKNLVNSKRVWLPCILYNANFAKFWKRIFSSLVFFFWWARNTNTYLHYLISSAIDS